MNPERVSQLDSISSRLPFYRAAFLIDFGLWSVFDRPEFLKYTGLVVAALGAIEYVRYNKLRYEVETVIPASQQLNSILDSTLSEPRAAIAKEAIGDIGQWSHRDDVLMDEVDLLLITAARLGIDDSPKAQNLLDYEEHYNIAGRLIEYWNVTHGERGLEAIKQGLLTLEKMHESFSRKTIRKIIEGHARKQHE